MAPLVAQLVTQSCPDVAAAAPKPVPIAKASAQVMDPPAFSPAVVERPKLVPKPPPFPPPARLLSSRDSSNSDPAPPTLTSSSGTVLPPPPELIEGGRVKAAGPPPSRARILEIIVFFGMFLAAGFAHETGSRTIDLLCS